MQTRPKNSPIDGVGIVAILQKPSGPELLLQKQFRPPINKVTIEVPAGLVDEGETAAESAVRELREETGYHGVVAEVSPVMFNGKGAFKCCEETQKALENVLLDEMGFGSLVGSSFEASLRVFPSNADPHSIVQIPDFATRTSTWSILMWI